MEAISPVFILSHLSCAIGPSLDSRDIVVKTDEDPALVGMHSNETDT